MDKDHKEELQQNDLQEFLTNFGEWWARHGTTTLLVILVIVGGSTGYRWMKGRDARAKEAAWTALAQAGGPESLRRVAYEQEGDWGVSQMALLQAANVLQRDAMGMTSMQPGGGPDVTTTELSQETADQLMQAAELYQQVIDTPADTQGPSLMQLNARLGLAAVCVTLGEFDDATEHYEFVRSRSGHHKALSVLADAKIRELDALREPIAFAADPEPEPESEDGADETGEGAADEPAADPADQSPAEAETPTAP